MANISKPYIGTNNNREENCSSTCQRKFAGRDAALRGTAKRRTFALIFLSPIMQNLRRHLHYFSTNLERFLCVLFLGAIIIFFKK